MRKLLLPIIGAALIFMGCNEQQPAAKQAAMAHKVKLIGLSTPVAGEFIPVDSANKMILSYLTSIHFAQNDTDLHSLIFDADSLRAFLNNTNITKVKFMFAHTLDYINNGGQNQYCGYQSGALTIVVAGYDSSNNYVFYNYPQSPTEMVLEHGMPCPSNCPVAGTATNNLLR